MKMNGKILILLFVMASNLLFAQTVIESGSIEYERKTNIHKLYQDNEWFDRMKDQVQKYHTAYYDLFFTNEQAYFKPGKEVENKVGWFAPPAIANQVHVNLKSGTVTAYKTIFEQNYLVTDSMRSVKWKITNEFRNIAGFECRKAVGKIYDTVIVVAFYCDEIAASIGPENINGLPGAILGLAIPRMYTTWFATKVTKAAYNETLPIEIPKKGTQINSVKMKEEIKGSLKDWGSIVNKMLWFVLL